MLWLLGYHGVFFLILGFLGLSAYWSFWELYSCWLSDSGYLVDIYTLVDLGNGLLVDVIFYGGWLSMSIICVMTIGSLMVLSFIYVEMWDDKEGAIFTLLLVLFLVFMAVLVLGQNIIVFYIGWEGIGIVSLFLINFWSERVRGTKAVLKVFFINKVGDILLLIGMSLLVGGIGIIDFFSLDACPLVWSAKVWSYGGFLVGMLDIVMLLFIVGGGVKSSQYGFHIWLLEAMEAPLGASALMHSSTLVVAGIILVYKLYAVLVWSNLALYILVMWGSWTSLFSAWTACWQYELKVILAYSTISSMGFIYMLLGLGALYEASIYLIMHAFLKIFLFLTIGLIMFFAGGMQDIRWSGGLLCYIPYAWGLYFSGAVGLGGLPYWSGYVCKSYLWSSLEIGWGPLLVTNVVALLSTLFTYIYLFRLGLLVFWGSRNGHRAIYRNVWSSCFIIIVLLYLCFFSIYWITWWVGLMDTSVSACRYSFIWWSNLINDSMLGILDSGWLLFVLVYILFVILLIYVACISALSSYTTLLRIYLCFNWSQLLIICWAVFYAAYRVLKYIYNNVYILIYCRLWMGLFIININYLFF